MKLTPEEKKQREIAKWEKEKAKDKAPGYMAYFLLIICIVYIGISTVVTIIPGMVTGLIMMALRVRETKGVDMGAVTVERSSLI